ncbi:glycerophosphodiester phosphodiesterase family protein [Ancylostoma duodenale]|uniref:Glycerophosphodiester phosphodiesterase family protein n=2 Tax=Ancylostoma TaxID=29169 RepID=A0A0C2DXB5_9BILA|nr:glycerophosphodiester phosphodiesterase family protein [Ancylostoma duodenale]
MEVSYSRHWKKRNTIEVGHRGAGNSFTKFAAARENTIYSLNTAAKNGADYVEFDVQLTKDKVAIIYHDFHVLVSVAKRHPQGVPEVLHPADMHSEKHIDYHEIPVKDLKLSQLKLLMLDHVNFPQKKENVKKLVEDGEEEEDFKPFPTLVEALTKVDPDVGFNVEVKYPMMQSNGEHECDHYFERNEFIDVVLADLLNNAGARRIMFSSFDPDICSLISMKQNKYPVLFLCVGETQRYTRFQDQRSSTSLTAVNFAAGADIMGVNFNSEDLLNDPYPVKRANDFGLITFVWGDDLDKKENINYFKKELGVDGLIYDRIGEDERRRNVFIVEREQKRALFKMGSGTSTPQR